MRIVLIHPNYHSGGAEIAGNWPPAWVAYLAGPLKKAGFTDITFIDAMTNDLSDAEIAARIAEAKPDIVGATAITPSIYKAERALQIARETCPEAVTVLGGVHATFMYKQVLSEAPWIDAIVRGEGEEIFLDFVRCDRRGPLAGGSAPDQGPRLPRARHRRDRRHAGGPHGEGTRRARSPTGRCWNGRNTSTCR